MNTFFDDVNCSIKESCGVCTDLDAQQILDLIVGVSEDKFTVYNESSVDWDKVMNDFYGTFKSSDLSSIVFNDCGLSKSRESHIRDRRNQSPHKEAPDSYFMQLLNFEVDRPPTELVQVNNVEEVLVGAYVAYKMGNNYGALGYPPKLFIEKVMCSNISREEFYSAVIMCMMKPESFLSQMMTAGKRHDISEMIERYEQVFHGKAVTKHKSWSLSRAFMYVNLMAMAFNLMVFIFMLMYPLEGGFWLNLPLIGTLLKSMLLLYWILRALLCGLAAFMCVRSSLLGKIYATVTTIINVVFILRVNFCLFEAIRCGGKIIATFVQLMN